MLVAEPRQQFLYGPASGLAHDVANEQQVHAVKRKADGPRQKVNWVDRFRSKFTPLQADFRLPG
jgi:hypothetical protein